jgi:acyl carrier protein
MNDHTLRSRADVVERLQAALQKVTGQADPPAALSESARLRDDLGLDSFAALELLFELEDGLGVRIGKSAAMSFQTVGDVVTYVLSESATGAAAQPAAEGPVPS